MVASREIRHAPRPRVIDTVALLVTSRGNEFMLDIAAIVHEGFVRAGVRAELLIDTVPSEWPSTRLTLVVGPHEFFPLFVERLNLPAAALMSQAYMLNVEQPGSQWFEATWQYARRSRGVVDISPDGARLFRDRGLPTFTATLGWVPGLEWNSSVPLSARPIDILFLGHASERRKRFFAAHADVFSTFRTQLIFANVDLVRTSETPGYVAGAARRELVAASRIVLNVHSNDRSYFESHRAMLALANRCLFVTEDSQGAAPLQPGVDFVSGRLDSLPSLCAEYLGDQTRLESIANQGYDTARQRRTMERACRELLDGIARHETDVAVRGGRANAYRISAVPSPRESNAAFTGASPRVSVIIATDNHAGSIERCLQSILQSRSVVGDFEVIVVDDASSDDSARLAAALLQSSSVPGTVIRKPVGTGVAAARNCGIEQARGSAVMVLDANQALYPLCLHELQRALGGGNAAAAYGVVSQFADEGAEPIGLKSAFDWNVPDLLRRDYLDAAAMFDRQALVSVGKYSTNLAECGADGWEDYDLWLKLANAGATCRFTPAILAVRYGTDSAAPRRSRPDEMARCFFERFGSLVERHPGLDLYFGEFSHEFPALQRPTLESLDRPELTRQLQLAQRHLEALHASWSWRITAPLRSAASLLHRRPIDDES